MKTVTFKNYTPCIRFHSVGDFIPTCGALSAGVMHSGSRANIELPRGQISLKVLHISSTSLTAMTVDKYRCRENMDCCQISDRMDNSLPDARERSLLMEQKGRHPSTATTAVDGWTNDIKCGD